MYNIENGDIYEENVNRYYSVKVRVTVTKQSSYDEDEVVLASPKTISDETYEFSEYGSIYEIVNKKINNNYSNYFVRRTGKNQYCASCSKTKVTNYYGSWLYIGQTLNYDFTFCEISRDKYVELTSNSYVNNNGADSKDSGCLKIFLIFFFLIIGFVLIIYMANSI